MSEEPVLPRRSFLAKATCALGACAGAAAVAPALAAILSPLDGGIVLLGEGLLDLGPLDGFEKGVAKKVAIRAARTDAYLKEDARSLGSVLVLRTDQGVVVFAAQCPHAGCDAAPAANGKFSCPCHESRFGADGSVEAGPSPRGLDKLETEIKEGRLLVRFERFQVGVAEKKAL
jgi:Rieske Fe-S protein